MAHLVDWWRSFGDRRKRDRRVLRHMAYIKLDDNQNTRSCMVADLSESGAKLTCVELNDLPAEFTLMISRRCRIARHAGDAVGVHFIDLGDAI